jgi:hypothetical protein
MLRVIYVKCHLYLVSFIMIVIYAKHNYGECHLWRVSFMLSVIHNECH